MLRILLSIGGLFAAFFMSSPALAWGQAGHRFVAQLAEQDLEPQVRAEIDRLLVGEAEPTLAGVSTWADELRANDPDLGRRSAKWHYVNIAESNCRYDRARDCPGGDCVVDAIQRQLLILGDRTRPQAERAQALKFVVHFVGDAHQPMHAGYAHDRGGNNHQVNYRKHGTNLHAFWDSGMLNAERLSADAWLQRLRARPASIDPAMSLPPPAGTWAEDACRIAVTPGVYPARARIRQDYVTTHLPLVEQQLRDAGARLGALLNATLAR